MICLRKKRSYDMANYVFFVPRNPRALILIAPTFTGIEISNQIFIVLFGLSRNFGLLENWSGHGLLYYTAI